jgi:hypothetical protein
MSRRECSPGAAAGLARHLFAAEDPSLALPRPKRNGFRSEAYRTVHRREAAVLPTGLRAKLAARGEFRFSPLKAGGSRSENTSQSGMCLVENRGEA